MKKKKLNLNKMKKSNIVFFLFMVIFPLLFLSAGIYSIIDMLPSLYLDGEMFILIPTSSFIIFPLLWLRFGIKEIKANNRYNSDISNFQFKIVEDKVYDKDYTCHNYGDGKKSYYYYAFGKIFGEVSVDRNTYYNIQKNSSIYYIIADGQNYARRYNDTICESDLNDDLIERTFDASEYELDNELQSFLVPYNEELGELNFNDRMKNEFKEKRYFDCKACNKRFENGNSKQCPHCGIVYEFDIKDFIHEKEWY